MFNRITYASIDEVTVPIESASWNHKRLIALVVITSTLFVTLGSRSPAVSVFPKKTITGLATTQVRDCSFEECFASSCDARTAPFICQRFQGGPHGGCSASPWVEGTCDDSCNLEVCESLSIPADTESCLGVQCGEEWCDNGQMCGDSAPYQCQVGSARFGCAGDYYQWTLKTASAVCSDCCDVTTC
eukprot:CAMPEP_0171316848 /NCGR_PEP_ID=MMETSP0816-20121228/76241_1 /TAXON_ID=420281 /ORGANISM="Proboscia inermis, Strain CCAP1064/1" /LENGTH=186 /DNA_ID=CAMNT_0011809415 /DNA_START=9 /DNA_END=569 /DNA_ORIENTATION=+